MPYSRAAPTESILSASCGNMLCLPLCSEFASCYRRSAQTATPFKYKQQLGLACSSDVDQGKAYLRALLFCWVALAAAVLALLSGLLLLVVASIARLRLMLLLGCRVLLVPGAGLTIAAVPSAALLIGCAAAVAASVVGLVGGS